MNKIRRNLIKIRSCAIFSLFRFSSYFKVDKRPISCWCDCSSSGSQIFGGQIVHINEGKGKLALFSTKDNAFYLPISLFILTFLLLHNFIILSIVLFPLHNINLSPPPPHSFFIIPLHNFYYFPSSIFISLLLHNFIIFPPPPPPPHLFYIFFHPQIHRPPIDPTSTPHRPHIDPTSTQHRP